MAHLPPNHPKELIEVNRYHKYAGVAILLGILVSILFACNPQKPVRKSINRVLQNDTAFAKVGAVWQRLNPCLNDTVLSNQKPDTVGGEVYLIHDSIPVPTPYAVFKNRKIDTVVGGVRVSLDTNGVLRLSIPKQKPLYITNPPKYITDNRAINQLNELLRIREKENENLKGQLTTTQKELKSYKLYLGILFAVVLLFLLIKAFKFVRNFPQKQIKNII